MKEEKKNKIAVLVYVIVVAVVVALMLPYAREPFMATFWLCGGVLSMYLATNTLGSSRRVNICGLLVWTYAFAKQLEWVQDLEGVLLCELCAMSLYFIAQVIADGELDKNDEQHSEEQK
jgi:hypothetical protein